VSATRSPSGRADILIDGRWIDAEERREVVNPADDGVVGTVSSGTTAMAAAAADASAAAFADWSARPARDRAEPLHRTADALVARAADLGRLLARETGKRLPEAVAEIVFAADYFRWFAEEAQRPRGAVLAADRTRHQLTFHRAAGVAVCLTPWNFPVSIQARKVAAALAAGCTVVSRPSEKAPLTVVELFRILDGTGCPAGVANLVHGPAGTTTHALLSHPAVRVVSFTGSTDVGRQIMRMAAERIVRPALELGGNAPFVVFADADLDAAVDGALIAKFRNNGQSCIAANRFLVHESVVDEFAARMAARVDAMSVGDPCADPVPDLGPLIDRERIAAVTELVLSSLDAGAKLLTAAKRPPAGGSFIAPVLVRHDGDDVPLVREEVFGPAAVIGSFADDDEAVRRANATEMGLAGYIYTRDVRRAMALAERLEVGILGVNQSLPSSAAAPMGGVKQSGLGREGAGAGLEEFQETHYVAMGR
jgi:succinate-semialdehyde dehydrogenase/glutarate-semialdehyde dehydrogenase